MRRLLLLGLALSLGCTEQLLIPESTTVIIGPQGGRIFSADGHFGLIYPQGALTAPLEVRIETDRTTTLARKILPIYRVYPERQMFSVPIDIIVDPAVADQTLLAMVSVHDAQDFIGRFTEAGYLARTNNLGCNRECADIDGGTSSSCDPGSSCIDFTCRKDCQTSADCEHPWTCVADQSCPPSGQTCSGGQCNWGPGADASGPFDAFDPVDAGSFADAGAAIDFGTFDMGPDLGFLETFDGGVLPVTIPLIPCAANAFTARTPL
ncbi:MAG: hypothetical protein U1E65_03895 [Myxococcota bacterium]